MAEENNDANTSTEEATGADSSSDAVTLEPIQGDDGLVSTVEYQTVEKEEPAETDANDADTSDDAEQNTPEDQVAENKDFHENPRFKELIDQKNQQADEIKGLKNQIDELTSQMAVPAQETGHDSAQNFNNIMAMDDDQIVEDLTSNPKQFLANFANQIAHELKMDISAAEQAKQTEAETLSLKEQKAKTITDFFADKEDGQAMRDDGRIKSFIEENPGHNEISAYHALAGEAAQEAAIESAVKKREAEIYQELKAKGKAKSTATPTGGSLLSSDKSPEMKNPDKFGGTENVLLKRHLARQAS